jgi:hypothetical protein
MKISLIIFVLSFCYLYHSDNGFLILTDAGQASNVLGAGDRLMRVSL